MPKRQRPQAALAVHPWPASRALLVADSGAAPEVLVISVVTPDSTLREAARTQLRGALREVLSLQLGCAPESIALMSVPGQALRIERPGHGRGVGLSTSHEAGLSVAALRRSGPVGVDIMRITPAFDWQAVARDYLGPQALRQLARQPEPEQLPAFAREWTRLEACLKCLGLALQEWSPALAQRLESCRLMALDLPSGLCGAVAWC
ncbi:MAG: 4'-phosphopantetheinyl transferase family protein [Polaromonas sp.]